jgi:NitT/TauT family transport system ATP-binding protein
VTSHLRPIPKIQPLERRTVLEVKQIRKIFPVDESFLTVLDGIDFAARRGEMICIVGRSGCGKSTLLKILAGFLPPTSGEVLINGIPVSSPSPDRCVVFQEDALFPWLTVRENIAFGLKGLKKGKGFIQDQVNRFLSLVGLSEFGDYLPRDISGGMKQRVALARVLILNPQVLLMDEPFASLDAQTRDEMQNLLLSLWQELSHTVVFVTHDGNEAVTLADRILVMAKNPGRVRSQLTVDLPRPRERQKTEFLVLTQKLYDQLRD